MRTVKDNLTVEEFGNEICFVTKQEIEEQEFYNGVSIPHKYIEYGTGSTEDSQIEDFIPF